MHLGFADDSVRQTNRCDPFPLAPSATPYRRPSRARVANRRSGRNRLWVAKRTDDLELRAHRSPVPRDSSITLTPALSGAGRFLTAPVVHAARPASAAVMEWTPPATQRPLWHASDPYLRMLLIPGARSVLSHAKRAAPGALSALGPHVRAHAGPQHSGRRAGQQARPHRLGRVDHRHSFRGLTSTDLGAHPDARVSLSPGRLRVG